MDGYTNNWNKKIFSVARFMLRNLVLLFPSLLLSVYLVNTPSELGSFLITLFSLYYGWFILEVITIFRTPVVYFELVKSDLSWGDIVGQYILKVALRKDVFNQVFGMSKLNRLRIVKARIGGVGFHAKWGSSPEPLDYSKNTFDPSKIPNSNVSDISENSSDYIIMLWVKKSGKLGVADVWNYSDKENTSEIPPVLAFEVLVEDDTNTYKLSWS